MALDDMATRFVLQWVVKDADKLKVVREQVVGLQTTVQKMGSTVGSGLTPLRQFSIGLQMMGSSITSSNLTRMIAYGSAIGLVTVSVGALVKSIFNVAVQFSKWRKELGMDNAQVEEFGKSVIDVSRQYGVAIDKVGTIAIQVAAGTGKVKQDIIDISAALTRMALITGADANVLGNLFSYMYKGLHASKDETQNFLDVWEFVSGKMKVSFGEVIASVDGLEGKLKALDDKSALKILKQLPGAFIMAKGTKYAEQFAEAMGNVIDAGSKFGLMFRSMDENLSTFIDTVGDLVPAGEIMDTAILKMAEQYGVSPQALVFWKKLKEYKDEVLKTEATARGMSPEALKRALESKKTPMDELTIAVNKLTAAWQGLAAALQPAFKGVIEGITGALEELSNIAGWATGSTESKNFDQYVGRYVRSLLKSGKYSSDQIWEKATSRIRSVTDEGVEIPSKYKYYKSDQTYYHSKDFSTYLENLKKKMIWSGELEGSSATSANPTTTGYAPRPIGTSAALIAVLINGFNRVAERIDYQTDELRDDTVASSYSPNRASSRAYGYELFYGAT
jgi:hypothetical protein